MKVLYLDHPEADFLAAVLYLGLQQELGEGSVVEYPYKPSYHGKTHHYPSSHVCDPFPGQDPNGTTSPFAWMPDLPGADWGEEKVVSALQRLEFDLVVVASPRRNNTRAAKRLCDLVGRSRMPTIVLCDGEDYSDMRWDLCDLLAPHVYFKRELLPGVEMKRTVRVEPLPFASPIPAAEPKPKDIDVLFLGGGSWGSRVTVCGVLERELGGGFHGGIGRHLSYPDYLDAINRSRIAVSVRGFGHDTLRFWEIPSFETMMVCDRLPIRKPEPFEDGVHAAYFDGPADLVGVVRQALSDADRRERIAKAGNAHLRRHHTARERARQMLRAAGYSLT